MDEQTTVIGPSATADLRELQAHIQAMEDEYARLNERHTELWQLRKQARLDREGYLDFLMVSDRMEVLLHELEAAKPQLRYREARAAVATGKSHFDALVPAVTEASTLVCQRWAAFIQSCQGFVELADEQIRSLWSLPDASGRLAFELPGGAELLQRLLGVGFPHAGSTSLSQMVGLTFQTPFTQGDQHRVVAMVPGTQPFPPGLVERYLAGFQPDEPKPLEDV
jgi:hypothetical protein